jgi:hypothetical protein
MGPDKSLSEETKLKISEAIKGIPKTEGHKTNLSIVKGGGTIFVYDTQGSLVNSFSSARKAAEHFKSSHPTIVRYVKNGQLFQDKWKLSIIEDTSACSKDTEDSD